MGFALRFFADQRAAGRGRDRRARAARALRLRRFSCRWAMSMVPARHRTRCRVRSCRATMRVRGRARRLPRWCLCRRARTGAAAIGAFDEPGAVVAGEMTSVFVSSCSSRSVSNTRPTLVSTSCTQSPKRPFWNELPWKALPGWMGVYGGVREVEEEGLRRVLVPGSSFFVAWVLRMNFNGLVGVDFPRCDPLVGLVEAGARLCHLARAARRGDRPRSRF